MRAGAESLTCSRAAAGGRQACHVGSSASESLQLEAISKDSLLTVGTFISRKSEPLFLLVSSSLSARDRDSREASSTVMAPTIADLQSTIERLEARVAALEAGKQPAASGTGEAMRMILIGPPGAGTQEANKKLFSTNCCLGKGTQAPNIKKKYGICHLVRDLDTPPKHIS